MTLRCLSIRWLAVGILLIFTLCSVDVILDSTGYGRKMLRTMPKISQQSRLLSQSRWSCKNETAIVERNLDCRRRLPHVIGIGTKKCGTGSLNFFLKSHPSVMTKNSTGGIHQWDWNPTRSMDDYRDILPITSQYQITMETTPLYFVTDDAPAAIARDVSPDVKLLLVLRDPVIRAISDYVHTFPKMAPGHKGETPVYPQANISYFLKDTFEESVLNVDGTVKNDNAIIFTGMYSRHLRNWYKVFPREQIYIVDGDLLSKNPLSQLQDIEDFLGLPKYFGADKFYFDEAKGFYCLALPSKRCMGKNKGRTHPHVAERTLKKLSSFYEAHNKELEVLTGRTFSWMKTK